MPPPQSTTHSLFDRFDFLFDSLKTYIDFLVENEMSSLPATLVDSAQKIVRKLTTLVDATDSIQKVVSGPFTYTFPIRKVGADTYALIRNSEELLKLQRDWLAICQLGGLHVERRHAMLEFMKLEMKIMNLQSELREIGKRRSFCG